MERHYWCSCVQCLDRNPWTSHVLVHYFLEEARCPSCWHWMFLLAWNNSIKFGSCCTTNPAARMNVLSYLVLSLQTLLEIVSVSCEKNPPVFFSCKCFSCVIKNYLAMSELSNVESPPGGTVVSYLAAVLLRCQAKTKCIVDAAMIRIKRRYVTYEAISVVSCPSMFNIWFLCILKILKLKKGQSPHLTENTAPETCRQSSRLSFPDNVTSHYVTMSHTAARLARELAGVCRLTNKRTLGSQMQVLKETGAKTERFRQRGKTVPRKMMNLELSIICLL